MVDQKPHTPAFRGPADVADVSPDADIGVPGAFPFTSGIQPGMYRGRPWTMRQYAGFVSASESNRRYPHLFGEYREA